MHRRQSITEDTLAIAVGMRRNTTARVRHIHPGQIIAAIILASLTLLIASTMVLGALVQRGVVPPPQRDVRLGEFHLTAFASNDPACANYPALRARPFRRVRTGLLHDLGADSDWAAGPARRRVRDGQTAAARDARPLIGDQRRVTCVCQTAWWKRAKRWIRSPDLAYSPKKAVRSAGSARDQPSQLGAGL